MIDNAEDFVAQLATSDAPGRELTAIEQTTVAEVFVLAIILTGDVSPAQSKLLEKIVVSLGPGGPPSSAVIPMAAF